ncbi:MAG: hypothetical protein ABWY52_06495 [Candidatus Limnocylindrales bacterium]
MTALLRLILVAFGLIAVVLAGCSPSAASAPPNTGIRGIVTLGPTCPVQQVDQPPCVEPFAATLAVTSAEDGSVVARVDSGADGTFTVDVPPGDYVVVPEPGGDPFPLGQPVEVTVAAGAYSEIEVAYDSGIR